jgi:DUF438 domain-containing protein
MTTEDIGTLLHAEHLDALAVANALEVRILGAEKNRPLGPASQADQKFVDQLVAALDSAIYRHYRFEEDTLFPLLQPAGLQDVTAMLTGEHETIRTMADELRALAKSAAGATLDSRQWTRFRETAMDFIHAVMFHIQKEEMGVVRSLSLMLGAAASADLAQRYRALQQGSDPSP